jgi:arsenate reductase (thioredoxin)
MAEGYLGHAAGDKFEPLSAGIEPKGLNPLAVAGMQEIGIDISQQRSKDVAELLGQAIPYAITVCDNARERCPIFHSLTSSSIGASMTRQPLKAHAMKSWRYFVA